MMLVFSYILTLLSQNIQSKTIETLSKIIMLCYLYMITYRQTCIKKRASIKVLIKDTTFLSPNGDETAILCGHLNPANF